MRIISLAAVAALALTTSASAGIFGGGDKNTNTNVNSNTAIAGAAAAAKSSSRASSRSSSNSGAYAGGSNSSVTVNHAEIPKNTPDASIAVGSAGNCYPGAGVGASGPGWGVSLGGGRVDPECNVRMEMAALSALAGNPAGIMHACMNDKSMRKTLVAMGLCVVQDKQVSTRLSSRNAPEAIASSPRPRARPMMYTKCAMVDGTIRVGVKRGASEIERKAAVDQCKLALN